MPPSEKELIAAAFELGYEIVKDEGTDYYRYKHRFQVEDSGLFDTPAEAAQAVIDLNKEAKHG